VEFLRVHFHLEVNQKTKTFPLRKGVNAYGFKIRTTHLELCMESKQREKRRIRRMMEKLSEGHITKESIQQAVNA
jgi:hypothetical protein